MTALLPERLKTLDYWITERESMRLRHAAGLRPYTRDPVMAERRWCNVRRMDDRVSRWLVTHWYVGQRAKPSNVVSAATLARMINWPDMLAELLDVDWGDWREIGKRITARKARGAKFANSPAYQVLASASTETTDKYVVRVTAEVHDEHFLLPKRTMREAWGTLQKVGGLGSFMAGQIIADLRHVLPGEWRDKDRWAPMGPGSGMGLAYLLGRSDWYQKGKVKQGEFERHFPAVIDHVRRTHPAIWRDRKLEAHDVQNCLCELSKYARLRAGIHMKKRPYKPTAQPMPGKEVRS